MDPSGNSYKQTMDEWYGEGNYWYRGQAPGSWGNGGGSGSHGGGGSYGAPGQGQNGTGLNGVYYDWYSGSYRSTNAESYGVDWGYAYNVASPYGTSLPSNIDLNSISFGNQNGVAGIWYLQNAYAGFGNYLVYKESMWRFKSATNSGGFNQVSSTSDGKFGPNSEGYQYRNPAADIVTVTGSASGIYKNLPSKMVPIIAKHYGEVNFKFGTNVGRIGTIGDLISTFWAVNNLIYNPSSVEYWTDLAFAGFGWVPIYGDFGALLYSGAKDQIQTIQGNINNNRNPLQGTYIPGTGDIWFGY